MLRCGTTTGACAAAATKAAVCALFGTPASTVTLAAPPRTFSVVACTVTDGIATCAVRKDAGDDPDITDGVLVYATVRRATSNITIDGGDGIGRVTKPGLDQPVGAAAINSTPRRMIEQAARDAMAAHGYTGGLSITISIPNGASLAAKTFNPRLGIVGGLSILGTTGIVEPMSEAALVDTIRAELRLRAATGATHVLLIPGNYGITFCQDTLGIDADAYVKCSNFIGDAVTMAVEAGFTSILLVGHIGKLVKLGLGLRNTHSQHGDGRMETLIACALAAGAPGALLHEILDCVSTDAALTLLRDAGQLAPTMEELSRRIDACLTRWVPDGVTIGFVCFTHTEILAQSETADTLLKYGRN